MFKVKIKEFTFGIATMGFLTDKGFSPDKEYLVLGSVGEKLLLADEQTGEMVELFPRNCVFISK